MPRVAMVIGSSHPTSPARTRPQTTDTAPADTSATAGTSRRVLGPRLSVSRVRASAVASRPIGTLTQKIQCQSSPWVIAPPTSGPLATASPPMPPQIPTMAPRRSGGNAAARMVRLSGITIAAAAPWSARAAMRMATVGARAQAAEETLNSARPIANTRRRPERSPSAAAVVIPAANAKVNALTVHSRVARLAPRSRRIAGRAVITTNVSSATMKKATEVSASVQARVKRSVLTNVLHSARDSVDERRELLVELARNLGNAGIVELIEQGRGPIVLETRATALIGGDEQAQRGIKAAADSNRCHPGSSQRLADEKSNGLRGPPLQTQDRAVIQ